MSTPTGGSGMGGIHLDKKNTQMKNFINNVGSIANKMGDNPASLLKRVPVSKLTRVVNTVNKNDTLAPLNSNEINTASYPEFTLEEDKEGRYRGTSMGNKSEKRITSPSM